MTNIRVDRKVKAGFMSLLLSYAVIQCQSAIAEMLRRHFPEFPDSPLSAAGMLAGHLARCLNSDKILKLMVVCRSGNRMQLLTQTNEGRYP
jgi:hypothetical protein